MLVVDRYRSHLSQRVFRNVLILLFETFLSKCCWRKNTRTIWREIFIERGAFSLHVVSRKNSKIISCGLVVLAGRGEDDYLRGRGGEWARGRLVAGWRNARRIKMGCL